MGDEHLPGVPHTSVAAVLSLVFGLIAWTVLPFVGALVAVICGHSARSEIRRSAGTVDGDGLAVAGLILGWLQLLLFGLIALAVFGLLGFASGVFGGTHWVQQLHDGWHGSGMAI